MFEPNTILDRWAGTHARLPIAFALFVVTACSAVFAANNPVPFIDLPVVPAAAVPGGTGFTLTVNGAGYVSGSVVNWNGSPRATTFVSAGQVTAAILASDIVTASTARITVSNPAPGGGTSSVAYFEITNPASSVLVAGLQTPELQGLNPLAVLASDLNNDGKLDLIVFLENVEAANPYVALGNGDGTFQPLLAIQNATVSDSFPALLPVLSDFNDDGKVDLALINFDSSTVSILLGNGDGTFQSPIVTQGQSNTGYTGLTVGDFNQDGNLDIIANYHNGSDSGISLWLGNGDGTFQSPVNTSLPIYFQYGCGNAADYNGDGKLDLLCFSQTSIAVLPGNGDGTFQAAVNSSFQVVTGIGFDVQASYDVNGDGKLDLLLNYSQDRPLAFWTELLLGNGDGSFQAATQPSSGAAASPPADFNGDGKLDFVTDAALAPFPADDLSIWIGNGDGTFANPVAIKTTTGLALIPLLQGDFNGDGKQDLLAQDYNGGGLWMFLQGSFPVGNPSPASLSFGNQTVGTSSAPQIITLTNNGTQTLTLSAVNISGTNQSQFKQTNTCTTSLAVGAGCQMTVTFVSTVGGTQSAILNIPHNGLGGQSVPLTGVGDTTPPTVKLPADLTFPAQGIGTKSSGRVTLTNPGPGTVTAPVITLTGADAGDFVETNTCNSELPAGASCPVAVTFFVRTLGGRSASLNFTDNASGSPQSVLLRGSGPDFVMSAPSPASLTITAGETASYSLGVQPLAGFDQTVTITCGGAPAGATCMLPATVST